MSALATFLAITGWIVCGLILTGIAWVISRWLGRVAAGKNLYRAGGRAGTQPTADTRTVAQKADALTHGERRYK